MATLAARLADLYGAVGHIGSAELSFNPVNAFSFTSGGAEPLPGISRTDGSTPSTSATSFFR